MCSFTNCLWSLKKGPQPPSPFLSSEGSKMYLAMGGWLWNPGHTAEGRVSTEPLTAPLTAGQKSQLGGRWAARAWECSPVWALWAPGHSVVQKGSLLILKSSSIYSTPSKHRWRAFLWKLEEKSISVLHYFSLQSRNKRKRIKEVGGSINFMLFMWSVNLLSASSIPTSKRHGFFFHGITAQSRGTLDPIKVQQLKLCYMFSASLLHHSLSPRRSIYCRLNQRVSFPVAPGWVWSKGSTSKRSEKGRTIMLGHIFIGSSLLVTSG